MTTTSEHRAHIRWRYAGEDFGAGRYSREHSWTFDGGLTVPASASPSIVAAPWSSPAAVDPEEALVASISSCHMLTFVHLARLRGFHVEAYEDEAVGTLTKNERGVPWVSRVVLDPRITYGVNSPTAVEEAKLHEEAHAKCFIANSVKTAIELRGAVEA